MNEKICGTYWLVATSDGSKFITQGEKPKKIGDMWIKKAQNMAWLYIEGNLRRRRAHNYSTTLNGTNVTSSDYAGLNFPDITNSDDAMEIEIGKSGKVYTYEP